MILWIKVYLFVFYNEHLELKLRKVPLKVSVNLAFISSGWEAVIL